MSISRDEVLRIAHLARLEVDAGELDALAGDMARILALAARLRHPDGEDAGPAPAAPRLRADEPGACLAPGEATAPAPGAKGGFFRVPPVIEKP